MNNLVETVNNQFAEMHVDLENLKNEFRRLQVHDHADREPGGELPDPERRDDRDPAGVAILLNHTECKEDCCEDRRDLRC